MGENSHPYRPEMLIQNGRTSDKYSNAGLTLAMSQEKTMSSDLARLSQNQQDAWDHLSSCGQNILTSGDLRGPSQINSQAHNKLIPRVQGWDRERHDGTSISTSNPLDMSLTRALHAHETHSSEHLSPISSRNQRAFVSSQAPHYPSRGSFSSSSKNTSHRNSRTYEPSGLLEAVQKRDQPEITRLLQSGVDVNECEAGSTALHLAAKNGDIEIMKYLLKRGASARIKDQYGRIPGEYLPKNSLSIDAICREIHLANQKPQAVHAPSYDWRTAYNNNTHTSTSATLPTSYADTRRANRSADTRLSSDHRPPGHRLQPDHRLQDRRQPTEHRPSSDLLLQADHRLPSEHRPPDHRLPSENRPPDHRLPPEHRPPDHRLPSEHRPPDHRLPSEHRPPDHRLPAEHRPQDHRPQDHRLSDLRVPEHRPPDHRLPDYSNQTRSAEKQRYHRSSPAHHDTPQQSYGTLEKRPELYNHADQPQSLIPSQYDRFPSPFEHMLRPPQSGSLPPGLELPVHSNAPEHHLPISNGPKSYRISEPVHLPKSKYGTENSIVRSDQRKTVSYLESKKPAFSIDEITKSSTMSQGQRSSQDKNNRLAHMNQTHLAERPDASSLLCNVNPARLPSTFGLDAQSRLSVASNLPMAHHSLYYLPSPEVPYQLPPVLYSYLNPSGISIPGSVTQVTPSKQSSVIQQSLKAGSSTHKSQERCSISSTSEVIRRKQAEQKVPVIERKNASSRLQDQQDHIRSRGSFHPDVRLPRPEQSSRRPEPPLTTLQSQPVPLVISSAKTISTSTVTVTTFTQISHSVPTPTLSSVHPFPSHSFSTATPERITAHDKKSSYPLSPKPFSVETPEGTSLQDVDMRKLVSQESMDTDLRPFLLHPGSSSSERQPDKVTKKEEKRKDVSESKQKNRRGSTSSNKDKLERKRLSSSTSVDKGDLFDPKTNNSRSVQPYTKNMSNSDSNSKNMNEPNSEKNRNEITQKRKYTKVTAPTAKVALEEPSDEFKIKKSEGDGKPETKPKGIKGRKRKHSPGLNESIEVALTVETNVATTCVTTTTATTPDPKDVNRLSSVEDSFGKREKRRKKSEPEDEYVYDWMYDDFSSDPENDDSEDEDFHCPIPKLTSPGRRGRKRGIRPRSVRHSRRNIRTMFFGGDSSPDEEFSDEDELLEEMPTLKPKKGRRGRKPNPRRPQVSPKKQKKSRKLSSDSAESENSFKEIAPSAKMVKNKKKIKLVSSDKEEKDKEPEKPVVKRGRGHKKSQESKDHPQIKKQESKSVKEDKMKSSVKRGCKNASKESKVVEKDLFDNKHEEQETKKPSKEKWKTAETEAQDAGEIKETNLFDSTVQLSKTASDASPQAAIVGDFFQEFLGQEPCKIASPSNDTLEEKKAKREKNNSTTIPARRGRKPLKDKKRVFSVSKRESKSTVADKKELAKSDPQQGRKLSFKEKKENNHLSNDKHDRKLSNETESNPELIRFSDTKRNKLLNDSVQDKELFSKQESRLSESLQRETISDTKREKKLAKRKTAVDSICESNLALISNGDNKPTIEAKRTSEAKKEGKTAKGMKGERKLTKQKSLGEGKREKKKEKISRAFSQEEKLQKDNVILEKKAILTPEFTEDFSKSSVPRSLIELYTGKHVEPIAAKEETSVPIPDEKPEAKNSLFWDDLTETEAQVLAGRGILVNEVSDSKISTKASEKAPVSANVQRPTAKIQNLPLERKLEISKDLKLTKVPKKRGRKPNSLLKSKKQDSAATPQKRLKLASTANKPAPHQNIPLTNKLAKPRKKGRPPGSLNKNKLKKGPPVAKNWKKPGRKAMIRVGRIPETNEPIPSIKSSTRDRPSTPSKNRFHLRTPNAIRPLDQDRGVTSPSSSIPSTPHMSKHLLPRIHSRGSTPVRDRRTPNPISLPPNVKKLTCNSAIGETLLHKAVRHGYMDNIVYYLEHGFDVNTKDNAGYTALHEACVKGRVEAAKLLLEFGADVNINSEDGTRPIHDAVEYDRVEVTRLLLSCGADPMLSKFSGRAIRDMIHGETMRSFLTDYLSELKPTDKEKLPENRSWNLSESAVLDTKGMTGCDVLAHPPDEDSICDEMEFELLEDEPINTYLLHPSDSTRRGNYYCLAELTHSKNCSREEFLLQHPADIKITEAKKLREDLEENWVKKKLDHVPEAKDGLVELIAAESYRKHCRVFKVDSSGVVTPILSAQSRCKPTYYHGAFCEKRTYAFVDPQLSGMSVTGETVDIPSCSRSTIQSCESPDFSDGETVMSGVTSLPVQVDESHDDKTQQCKVPVPPKTDLPDLSGQNGIVQNSVSLNGYSCQNAVTEPRPVLNLDPSNLDNSDQYVYQPMDIATYSPTSDLRPPVVNDNDPSRTLTETENAVLNLAYDTGLPSIQLHRSENGLPYTGTYFREVPSPNHVNELE